MAGLAVCGDLVADFLPGNERGRGDHLKGTGHKFRVTPSLGSDSKVSVCGPGYNKQTGDIISCAPFLVSPAKFVIRSRCAQLSQKNKRFYS